MSRTAAALAVAAALSLPAHADAADTGHGPLPHPLVIAHRGASASRPEHTLASYQKAVEEGADAVEVDIVVTRDGVLVARHENELSGTTDVADQPHFSGRHTVKLVDGRRVSGWFTEDFTLAELKTLRARERLPRHRPGNIRYDGQFEIPTLEEIIALVQRLSAHTGRTIGLYLETKHPAHFRTIGLPLEEGLAGQLHAAGYRDRRAPAFIQSFEPSSLERLRELTGLRLVQLLSVHGRPYDLRRAGDKRTYRDMAGPEGLRSIAGYADAIGPAKELVIARDANGDMLGPTSLVADAHAAGLLVHPWTFRPENPFLPPALREGDAADPAQRGNLAAEMAAVLEAGADGLIVDDPQAARALLPVRSKR